MQEEKPTIANAVKKFTSKERTEQAIRELIEYHVTEALKAALESIPCLGSSTDIASYEEVAHEVLNAYPLTNIE